MSFMFQPDLYRVEVRLEVYDGPALSLVLLSCLCLTPRRHQANGQLSLLYPPCQVKLVWRRLCESLRSSSLADQKHSRCCLV